MCLSACWLVGPAYMCARACAQVKPKGGRRITFAMFEKSLIEIAAKKKMVRAWQTGVTAPAPGSHLVMPYAL